MASVITIFQLYKNALHHFITIAKKDIFLSVYLCIAFICQIIYGLDFFDNIFLALLYPIGTFTFISIAYSLTYLNTDLKTRSYSFDRINLQLLVIGLIIVFHFISLSGQLPDGNTFKMITIPVRIFLHDIFSNTGLAKTGNSIVLNSIICVILPFLLISLISWKKSGYYNNMFHGKILFYLFLLYLPIYLFGYKSLNEIIAEVPYYLFMAAIPEEVLFRGFLQSRLEKLFKNPVNAILLASLVFGLMHIPINIKMYGGLIGIATCIGNNAFGGLFIGYLFFRTRSVLTVIIFHLISGIALS